MTRIFALLALIAMPAAAQMGPGRDPASVPLPAPLVAQLRLGSEAPFETFGAAFDLIAPDGAIPVVAPGVTLAIRAAADRARVFLAWVQYDLDGNGAVARAEFDRHAEMSWGQTLGAREIALLDTEWATADANADGTVTHSEIQGLALSLFPVPKTGPLGPEGRAMLLMDLDNDGYVIWDEVEAVLRAHQ